ncbi:MAG: alcohol dehydrogenase catalytic domain-containing protein, partial [Gemmatimonadota bacterium]
MEALQYVRSVPRYLATRWVGRRWGGFATSPLACLRLADVQPPTLPGPAWVRVQPTLSGICGSDLATIMAQGTPYFSPFTSTPFVFGHEVVGRVLDVGAAVTRVRPGDRVVLAPPLHCAVRGLDPLCDACQRGAIGHCRNVVRGDLAAGIQTGYCRDSGGGWSRELVAHELQLHRVPEAIPDEEAVLIEPFSCCLHAVERAALVDDDVVLVLGCGTIGALTIAAVRATGSRCRLIAVARYPHQQRAATALGADVVVGTGAGLRGELAALLG